MSQTDRKELKPYTGPYTGGLSMPPDALKILKQPIQFLTSCKHKGEALRRIYQDEAHNWNALKLSKFGIACYFGRYETVARMVQSGAAPALNSHETPFHWDYVSIVIFGAQRVQGPDLRHLECLEFLFSHGASLDSQDIVGSTALHHVCTGQTTSEPPIDIDSLDSLDPATYAKLMSKPHFPQTSRMMPLIRSLIKHGANVDCQNRYGEVPLLSAFPSNNIGAIDILLENGASLDVPEADGITPRNSFVKYGPQVTACVTKWIRKREGTETAPREGGQKRCGAVGCDKQGSGKEGKGTLMLCSRCQVERYCSTECQKKAWSAHKGICKPFDTSTTVVLKPTYRKGHLQPNADFVRSILGYKQDRPTPESSHRSAHVPQSKSGTKGKGKGAGKKNSSRGSFEQKNIIVKVQVQLNLQTMFASMMQPDYNGVDTYGSDKFDAKGDLLVYTKKRDFVCMITRAEQQNVNGGDFKTTSAAGEGICIGEKAFDKLVQVVLSQGVGKAYFAAVLKSEQELVVKVGEVLAEQPF